jgi:hypothetical protein
MRRPRRWIILLLAAAAASIFVSLVAVFLADLLLLNSEGKVRVVNAGAETIAEGKIIVCRQTLIFKNLKHGKEIGFKYKLEADSHYEISLKFESGKTRTANLGYVTRGFDFDDRIEITDADITLSSKTRR